MGDIARFATADVAPHARLDYWNQLAARAYAGMTVDSSNSAFRAQMWSWAMGDLTLTRPRSEASSVQRWRSGAPDQAGRVILHLQHRGTCGQRQRGRAATLRPGDFSVCAGYEPYRLDFPTEHEMLVVELPEAALRARVPDLDDRLAHGIDGSSPAGRILHDFLLSLWRHGDLAEADAQWSGGVADALADLLALAMRGRATVAPPRGATLDRVRALVDARLADPALKVGTIAGELGISIRSVQGMFAALATTPTAYILGRRLERAAERLRVDREESVTAIAFDVGFNDSAYFARCFRRRFGIAPSMWRSDH